MTTGRDPAKGMTRKPSSVKVQYRFINKNSKFGWPIKDEERVRNRVYDEGGSLEGTGS